MRDRDQRSLSVPVVVPGRCSHANWGVTASQRCATRYDCTSRRTVSIDMKSVNGSVGVGSKPNRGDEMGSAGLVAYFALDPAVNRDG